MKDRVIGSGPPLVLVMGYGWTMEGWDPRLVHALALRHRVVMFDNSGVGRTQELPQPFSVAAMADQTSALIDTLGLGCPASRAGAPPGAVRHLPGQRTEDHAPGRRPQGRQRLPR